MTDKKGYRATAPTAHPRSGDESFSTTGAPEEMIMLDVTPLLPLDSVTLKEAALEEGPGTGQYSIAGKVVTLHGVHEASDRGLRVVYRIQESAFLPASSVSIAGEVEVKNDSGNPLPVAQVSDTYSAKAVTASASGDNTVHAPAAGLKVRLFYVSLNADGANAEDVTVILKFGAAGAPMYKFSLKPGAIWARNIGAGRRFVEGAIDEGLVANLDAAENVHASIEYSEV